jgi:hypothetical protein
MISKQQNEVTELLKKTREEIRFLESNQNIPNQKGQEKLQNTLEMISKIIETDHYKIPFVKHTLRKEFFWFVTNIDNFGSRDLAIKLCDLQEQLA